ncbi:MAG: hypothetical protein WC479_11215 [Candidatus Izemoplasmatales bacterium]
MASNVLRNFKSKDEIVDTGEVPEAPMTAFDVKEELAATPESPTTNVLKNDALAPGKESVDTSFEQYWGQPIGGKKFKMPLDQFVRLAGMAAHAFNPTEASGILGKDLSEMGREMYGERVKRERDTVNELLRQRLIRTQIKNLEETEPIKNELTRLQISKLKEEQPKEWDVYLKEQRALGVPDVKIVKDFQERQRATIKPAYYYAQDDEGNISVFKDGDLISGSGKGKDVTKEVSKVVTDDSGTVTLLNKKGDVIGTRKGIGSTKETTGQKEAAKIAEKEKARKAGVGNVWQYSLSASNVPIRMNTKGDEVQIMDEATDKWRPATTAEVTGLTKVGPPAKAETEFDKLLRERREGKKAGAQPPAKQTRSYKDLYDTYKAKYPNATKAQIDASIKTHYPGAK